MKITRTPRSWVRPAAALATALGLTLAMASPALAAAGDSSSFGVATSGVINTSPLVPSAFTSGLASNTLASVNIVGLVQTQVINTTATALGATSEVNGTSVTLAPSALGVPASTLTASVINSNCSIDPTTGAATGTSSIVGGAVSALGIPTTLEASAAPNTTVSVPGIATIVLNRQTTAADGTLTVDAVYISLLGSAQTVTIASSSCTPGTVVGASMMPMKSALGASLLGLAGLVFFLARRRQTQHFLIEG